MAEEVIITYKAEIHESITQLRDLLKEIGELADKMGIQLTSRRPKTAAYDAIPGRPDGYFIMEINGHMHYCNDFGHWIPCDPSKLYNGTELTQ